jgi:hypothetical protein
MMPQTQHCTTVHHGHCLGIAVCSVTHLLPVLTGMHMIQSLIGSMYGCVCQRQHSRPKNSARSWAVSRHARADHHATPTALSHLGGAMCRGSGVETTGSSSSSASSSDSSTSAKGLLDPEVRDPSAAPNCRCLSAWCSRSAALVAMRFCDARRHTH